MLAPKVTEISSSYSLPAFFLCLALSGTISFAACAFGGGRQNNDGIGREVSIEERCLSYTIGVVTWGVMQDPKSPSVQAGVWYVGTTRM